ncbi:hypothetical protein BKA24_001657 [Microbacterium marinum]|uniref:Uncharacterized protein n=1 Tax=Microbacterium marinum TaxID=421115 RepID=A0A7W7BSN2_9MICO|nr:hypothetical protein [Microbacterium marinum]MBB4666948.1 hypothetical protein [Microbacterium marinum]
MSDVMQAQACRWCSGRRRWARLVGSKVAAWWCTRCDGSAAHRLEPESEAGA